MWASLVLELCFAGAVVNGGNRDPALESLHAVRTLPSLLLTIGAVSAILRPIMAFVRRLFDPPRSHFFLLGPRGTGKTLWTREQFPDALVVDLLDPATHREMLARPERLRELVEGNADRRQVVIDEVQKAPELLEVVHGLIEKKLCQQFILTGSSARKLRRAGVNLLGGRALHQSMHPYLAAELGKAFDLAKALRIGMLPIVWGSEEPSKTLAAYSGLYLREEVQQEGLVRDVGGFARFLEAMSFSHGAVLNLSNVARECQVKRKTCEGYLQILEDLLLGFRLDVFSKRAKREMAAHPKFYFFDTGVFRANRPSGPLDAPEEIEGGALEGLVAQQLRAWCDYAEGNHVLYYWQTRSQVEVDFVVYGESGIFAIEVKNAARIRPQDVRALRTFGEDYPTSQRILLYRGKDRLQIDGILCLPCSDFLARLTPEALAEASSSPG
jgi:predicted AAA+ superfamily ATPase